MSKKLHAAGQPLRDPLASFSAVWDFMRPFRSERLVKAKTSTSSPQTRTRYGTANPEQVENALWEQAIDEEWTGHGLRQHLGIDLDRNTFRLRQNFSHSAYREMLPEQPFWSWQRYGRTSTALPDGRVIHIAGDHEDFYDPDFCIYNDVVVQYAGGRREFFLYPKDAFPPTDFHTATLVGSKIVLIGSLSYGDLRRPGETQVLTLDILQPAHRTRRDHRRRSGLALGSHCRKDRRDAHPGGRRRGAERRMPARPTPASSSSTCRP